ncbi:hypothetical protein Goarm_006387, partial [Gossypium armourianum]|nr:hypothetical protein [Gossypium armourianum]
GQLRKSASEKWKENQIWLCSQPRSQENLGHGRIVWWELALGMGNDQKHRDLLMMVNQILIKYMAHTVVIKLLGRRIGYLVLHNKVCSLWKPSQPFRLMDVENGYFLAKFQNLKDFKKLLGLLGHMYKRKVLWEIWGTIGKVAKLDFNMDNEVWGRFARMAVHLKELFPNEVKRPEDLEGK